MSNDVRKRDLRLPKRPPAYVSRAGGAAELSISVSAWRQWVDDGILPPPAPGFPPSSPRWKWATVEAWLDGKHRDSEQATQTNLFGEGSSLLHGHRKRGPRPGQPNAGRRTSAGVVAAAHRDAGSAA